MKYLILLLLLISFPCSAAFVRIGWDASISPNVGGYTVFVGKQPRAYTRAIDVGNVVKYRLTGLTNNTKYYIAVQAYDTSRSITSTFSNEISYTTPLVPLTVDFVASTVTGTSPTIINFSNIVNKPITYCTWRFGDKTQPSTDCNPAHQYTRPGTYTVQFTSSDGFTTITKIKPDYIQIK